MRETIVSLTSNPSTLAVVNQIHHDDASSLEQPPRLVRLTQIQAGSWLGYLERICSSNRPLENGKPALESLRQLHHLLSDACWLARWKRENVILEVCMTMLPGLFADLLSLSQREQTKQDFDTLEEMIFELGVNLQP